MLSFLAAYTQAGEDGASPAFVSLSSDDDTLVFTVRRVGKHGVGFTPVEVAVPKAEAIVMLKDALNGLMTRDEFWQYGLKIMAGVKG